MLPVNVTATDLGTPAMILVGFTELGPAIPITGMTYIGAVHTLGE